MIASFLEQILYCFVSPRQHDWDLLLSCAEFDLNSSRSDLIGLSPVYTLYECEPNLPLKPAVHRVIDSRVASVLECVAPISDVVQSVHKILVQIASSIAQYANHKHNDVEVHVGDQAWLSTEYFWFPSNLSCKFAPKFVETLKVVEAVTPSIISS